jgi:hypothetical protein
MSKVLRFMMILLAWLLGTPGNRSVGADGAVKGSCAEDKVTGGQAKKNPGDRKECDEEIIPLSFYVALFPGILPAPFRARKKPRAQLRHPQILRMHLPGTGALFVTIRFFRWHGKSAAVYSSAVCLVFWPGADQFAAIITRCRAR